MKKAIVTLGIFIYIIMFTIFNNPLITSYEEIIFAMDDYVGDDDGPGGYLYPIDPVYRDGVFDLVYFLVEDIGVKLRFIFMFYELDDNPWNGPYGFSAQFIQVYIDSIPNEGNTETWYAKVHISSLDSWDVALLIGPGLRPEHNRIWYGGVFGSTYIDNAMDIYVNKTLSAIVAEVPKTYLPNIDNLDKWRYIVLVLGIDPESPSGVVSVAPGKPGLRAFGSGEIHREAAIKGIAPQVIDALYPDPEIQYEVLSSYSLSPPKYATIIAVPSPPLISIVIRTKTVTKTYTEKELVTKTMIKTKTMTIATKVISTTTIASTTTINRTKTKYVPYTIKTTFTKTTTQERIIHNTIYVTKIFTTLMFTKFITLTSTLTTIISKSLIIEIQNLLMAIAICLLIIVIVLLKKRH